MTMPAHNASAASPTHHDRSKSHRTAKKTRTPTVIGAATRGTAEYHANAKFGDSATSTSAFVATTATPMASAHAAGARNGSASAVVARTRQRCTAAARPPIVSTATIGWRGRSTVGAPLWRATAHMRPT
jgi:hypothetical protein